VSEEDKKRALERYSNYKERMSSESYIKWSPLRLVVFILIVGFALPLVVFSLWSIFEPTGVIGRLFLFAISVISTYGFASWLSEVVDLKLKR
jgi:polyferredoxin